MNEELKVTVGDTIRNVLNAVKPRSFEEGAVIMYHFLNGMLVGGAIDADKGIQTETIFKVREPDENDIISGIGNAGLTEDTDFIRRSQNDH